VKSNPKTTFLSFPKSFKRAGGFVGSSFSDSVRQRELLILSCPISLHLPSNKDLQISWISKGWEQSLSSNHVERSTRIRLVWLAYGNQSKSIKIMKTFLSWRYLCIKMGLVL
jgi:hypothetical protein